VKYAFHDVERIRDPIVVAIELAAETTLQILPAGFIGPERIQSLRTAHRGGLCLVGWCSGRVAATRKKCRDRDQRYGAISATHSHQA